MSKTSAQESGPTTKDSTQIARPRGRPQKLTDKTVLVLSARKATSKLRRSSERRAVAEWLLERGGKATVMEANKHFNYDVRDTLHALIYSGWVEIQ